MVVERFDFVGNTAFSDQELNQVLKDKKLINKPTTFRELLQAEQAITELYVSKGYINSGAVIEAGQTLSANGSVVKITIIEGAIEDIKITGNRHLNSGYIRSRLGIATRKPFNQNRLIEALQLLQLDPLIETISAQLSAGTSPDLSLLEVKINEAKAFDADIFANNGRNPSVGSFQRGVSLEHRNVLGFGDGFNVVYSNTSGSNSVDASYTIPFNARNGTIRLGGGWSSNAVIDQLFNELDITGNYSYYELSVRQPVLQSPSREFALGLTLSRQESKNFLLGEGFPLSLGADDTGEIHISALRFFQDWTQRNPRDILAVRSQFSFGIDAFNSTLNDQDIPDSNFFSWRGQGQYVRLLAEDTLLVVRSDIQLANKPLLALEQISIGGLGSVRGYPQDLLLTDNGFILSTEVRYPIFKASKVDGVLQIVPFVDFGTGWNNGDFPNPNPNALVGVGVGVLWQMGNRLNARFDWGIPLVNVNVDKDSLNAQGLYFSLDVRF